MAKADLPVDIEQTGSSQPYVRPLTPQRNTSHLRRKKAAYLFLEWPTTAWSLLYHLVMLAVCLITLIICLLTFQPNEIVYSEVLVVLEVLTTLWVIVDFALRFWSSSGRKYFQGWRGILRFIFLQPLSIIDMIIIIIGVATIVLGIQSGVEYGSYIVTKNDHENPFEMIDEDEDSGKIGFNNSALHAILFIGILRLFKSTRLFGGSRLILSVIKEQRKDLLTFLQLAALGFILFPLFMFVAEVHNPSSHAGSYMDSLWWSVITLTTVGYGDIRPITPLGKVVGGFAALYGVVVFFVPTGLMGVGIVGKLKERRNLERKSKNPAAALIQAQWRMSRRAVHENNITKAISIMKVLAARKKFRDTLGKEDQPLTQNPFAASHELICALESRMILMEKLMSSVLNKLNHLFHDKQHQ